MTLTDQEKRAMIRQWAHENNIECPKGGKIPARVTQAWLDACAEVYKSPETGEPSRLEIYFDPDTLSAWPATLPPRGRRKHNRIGTVLHYVENHGAQTPSGGKFVSRRFTIVIQGVRWVGTMKKDSNIVRLRPESEALANA